MHRLHCPISSRNPLRNAISAILAAIGLKARAPSINQSVVISDCIHYRGVNNELAQLSCLKSGHSEKVRVIFIHGSPGSAAVWSRYLNSPVDGVEYIAIDRPGYGTSTHIEAQPTLEQQTNCFSTILSEHKTNILVGHSYGGPVAAHAAIRFPDKVHGLILIASAMDPAHEKTLTIQRLFDQPTLNWLLPRKLRASNHELINLKFELTQLANSLNQLSTRVHIVHGTRDALVPVSNVDYMVREFSRCHDIAITRMPGRNHFIPWNSFATINQVICEMTRHVRNASI
jgi:pimeloyl-ACP methyl ester carboxylesterase